MILTNSKYEPYLNEVFTKYKINTPLRKSHFLAQIKHESGNFTRIVENLNYKQAKRLLTIFSTRFDINKNKKIDPEEVRLAEDMVGNPIKLANFVYANRMGNGDANSGDGYKYRGKGLIQLTGKSTQESYAKYVGVNMEKDPDFLLSPKYALDSAGWYWHINNLNKWADLDDIKTVTRKINGATIGLEDRIKNLNYYKSIIK
jgi:putative chitinase